jgi:hypothetical protein
VTLQDLLSSRVASESGTSTAAVVGRHSARVAASSSVVPTGAAATAAVPVPGVTHGAVGGASTELPEGYLLRAPDWQSLDKQDWVFCRTVMT